MLLSARKLSATILGIVALVWVAPVRADLNDYVKKDDGSFAWKLKETKESDAGKTYLLHLVSQKWQEDIVWDHDLLVFLPKDVKPGKTMLLMNIGGSASIATRILGMDLATRSQAPVAILHGIPKQPLFDGKTEDNLIAETFVRYLKTKDENWPLLFPMVKSVVKAMDALQAFSKQEWKEPLEQFIITGGSKRGWTTWLTAATGDKRVKAIAPMVFDVLSMVEQMELQKKSFGAYSEQVRPYIERKLVPLPDSPEAKKLWLMIDPYTYRDKLTLPKLLIMGNNDPYWATDALNLYWDGLKGDKWITYVPNAGHDLKQDGKDLTRVASSLAAFTRYQVADKPMPQLSWKHDDADGKMRLTIGSNPVSGSGRLWVATAPTRDFRKAKWEQADLVSRKEGGFVGLVEMPKEGCRAIYGELDFEIDGLKYTLCTQLRIAGTPVEKK
jgi:PhoPQ-activated pathogenicity-related protein